MEGQREIERTVDFYNLDVIISVGYRVTSHRGVLDFAELQALNRKPMYMADWITKLDHFLQMTERDILSNAGKISHETALDKARSEYVKYQ